jgi:ABC-type lipoprotein release transport system permease subunit
MVQMPLQYFQEVFSMRGGAHSIVITAASHEQTQPLTTWLRKHISDDSLDVISWERLQPGLKQAIQADFSTAWLMYGVLVALVAFSVLNTFLMSVLERTREFGIMLALGLTPGKVGRLVWTESLFMALTGMGLGMVAGAVFTSYFTVHGFSYPGMEELASKFNLPDRFFPQLDAVSLLLGPGVIFIATLLAALWPAARIHLLKPVEAMQTV